MADGDVPSRAALDRAWPGWLDPAALVVAADGGWHKALALGLRPALLVGDADSLAPETFAEAETSGVETIRVATAKDESDTELAVLEAARRGATEITLLGGLGGRLDHALANVGLLELGPIRILDATTRVRLLRACGAEGTEPAVAAEPAEATAEPVTLELSGEVGGIVSLIPLGATAHGVTTRGFLYPLSDEPLSPGPARGLSNVRTERDASVSLRAGHLLVIETTLPEES